MKTCTRATALLVLAGALVAVPGTSSAADVPRRVASLDGDYPGLTYRDPDATGRAVLTMYPSAGKVCYTFRWSKMEVRGLYVHRRSTDEVVTKLYDEYPNSSGDVKGCATEIEPARVREMVRYPGRFRVEAFPYDLSGNIAGTLARPPA